jgi:hypothetical protein
MQKKVENQKSLPLVRQFRFNERQYGWKISKIPGLGG